MSEQCDVPTVLLVRGEIAVNIRAPKQSEKRQNRWRLNTIQRTKEPALEFHELIASINPVFSRIFEVKYANVKFCGAFGTLQVRFTSWPVLLGMDTARSKQKDGKDAAQKSKHAKGTRENVSQFTQGVQQWKQSLFIQTNTECTHPRAVCRRLLHTRTADAVLRRTLIACAP